MTISPNREVPVFDDSIKDVSDLSGSLFRKSMYCLEINNFLVSKKSDLTSIDQLFRLVIDQLEGSSSIS